MEHPNYYVQRERGQEWNLESKVRNRKQGRQNEAKSKLRKIILTKWLEGKEKSAAKPVVRRGWLLAQSCLDHSPLAFSDYSVSFPL